MPSVAIIGKTNVGKSTLFNRFLKSRKAIESEVAGTTRDKIFGEVKGKKLTMTFIDTGGIMKAENEIEEKIYHQALLAIEEADLILFCVSFKEGLSWEDKEVFTLLRKKNKTQKPIFLVVTKCDRPLNDSEKIEFLTFPVKEEEIFFVSALTKFGLEYLQEKIEQNLLQRGFSNSLSKNQKKIYLTILGKPNVGKSSLINSILKQEKLIVSDMAGTTIDCIDSEVKFQKKDFVLIDTAGIRRSKSIQRGIEYFSVLRSLRSLQRSDIALFLIDPLEGISRQDQFILRQILEQKKGLILAINKWDQYKNGRFFKQEDSKEEARKKFLGHLREKLPFIPWAPVIFVSAQEKKNLNKIFSLAEEIAEVRQKRIKTSIFNDFLQEILSKHSLKGRIKKTNPKVKFGTQVSVCPPHFIIFSSEGDNIHFSSKRFIENQLRQTFDFTGTGIILEFRQTKKKQL